MKNRLKNPQIYIIPVALIYAGIYLYRMFTNNPWYDELYTYYSFISRGPVYAAIHWPLPNNHIGYSAISGFLSYFGNPTIALRGVSFICAVCNIVLLYRLAVKLFDEWLAYIAVFIYAGCFQVHNMAVQGRGYTLSTLCYLIAITMLLKICKDTPKFIHYAVYSLVMIIGIWAVPTSTFWVIPLCISGGVYLLFNKEIKTLIKLIIASLIAALGALFMYVVVWLSIGSNLLSKDPSSAYAGIYQLTVIKMNPLAAAQAGLDYMLASPYIQSMDRGVVVRGLFGYLDLLFEQFYSLMGIPIIVILAVTFVVALIRFIKDRSRFTEAFLCVSILLLPIMLIVQSVQPYLRVFCFLGIVLAFSILMYVKMILQKSNKEYGKAGVIVIAIVGALLIGLLFTYKYRAPMADRENDILEALNKMEEQGTGVNEIDSIYYTDDYQKYVIKFFFDADPPESPMGEASYVLVSDTVMDESITGINWPMLTSSSCFDFETLNNSYEKITETDKYIVYRKTGN